MGLVVFQDCMHKLALRKTCQSEAQALSSFPYLSQQCSETSAPAACAQVTYAASKH